MYVLKGIGNSTLQHNNAKNTIRRVHYNAVILYIQCIAESFGQNEAAEAAFEATEAAFEATEAAFEAALDTRIQ